MGSLTYDFSDETVIVTGGSSGIGREIARRFGAAGATVVVADVLEEPKDADESIPTHERIEDAGGRATFVETDVSDPDDVASVVEAAREFGGVDVMVNNAGIYRHGSLLETPVDEFDQVLAVNVRGVFAGCRAAAREMLAADDPGCIINTASISSEYAQLGHTMYDASKGAVMMLTRVAALELARFGIRVNAVAPGIIETTFGEETPDLEFDRTVDDRFIAGDAALPDPDDQAIETDIPIGRLGTPEDVASPYLFLATDDASYITGHLLYVDGGYQIL
ncbi:SDR family NAD(P)-dependent oxidoreductase [Natrinema salifodinae]|uniref:NAD(P)-dependent dehydrogenase, short-chain alcohol dehydrogenase family n=1 Tax=Natrinema salifodinae TaxID=1202768 RepID=A0A1I0PK24_9EURY|nr:SDR family oxidoreductase [Natrinema salifodinae]SEW14709.1 NAD(P)-dependent dehydrogenase, short-chain alcohol dehydrogenase family [Natrinema salifodinae]